MRRRVIKKEARKTLFLNRMYFIGTGFLIFLLVSGVSSVSKVFSAIVSSFVTDSVAICFEIVLYLLMFLFLSPALIEIFRSYTFLNTSSSKGKSLFALFSNKRRYIEYIRLSLFALVLFVCEVLLLYFLPKVVIAAGAAVNFGSGILESVFGLLLYCLCFFTIFVFSFYLNSFFMVFFFELNSDSRRFYNKLSASYKLMKGKRCELLLLQISFVPLFVTVYFTFGISLIFIFPYYLKTLCIFADYVLEDSKNSSFYAFI